MFLKRSLALIILVAFLFNLMGYYPYFVVLQYHIKNQIKSQIRENLDKDILIEISFNKSKNEQPTWVRQGKELIYGGKYYDIVSVLRKGSISVFYCIDDKKETCLVNQFMKSSKNRLRQVAVAFLHSLMQVKYSENDNQDICFDTSKPIKHFITNSSIHSRVVEFDTPPPKA